MQTPNPENYNIFHLGVSGGKDSTAALLWLCYESGWQTSKIRLSLCETENEDNLTYTYLAMLSELTGIDIEIIYPQVGSFWDLAKKKGRFPSRKARFCTKDLKVTPSMRHIETLKQEYGNVLILSGITRREGKSHNDRGNLEQFSHDDSYDCDRFLPIYEYNLTAIWEMHQRYIPLDWVITIVQEDGELATTPCQKAGYKTLAEELTDIIKKSGIPCNPLYHMGASRVGCFPCINSAKGEIRAMDYWRPSRKNFIATKEIGISNQNMYSSFFSRNTVPPYHRSKKITTNSGDEMMVATIDDVVQWSKTTKNKPWQFDLFQEVEGEVEICDLKGMCE